MKTLIVEDDPAVRDILQDYVQCYCPELQIRKICSGVREGIAAMRKYRPELVFLDLELRDSDCFEELDIPIETSPSLIFITAHDHYVVKAFRYAALNFVLKPIKGNELKRAIARAIKRHKDIHKPVHCVQAFHDATDGGKLPLAVPTIEGYTFVDLFDVLRLEAWDNNTRIYLRDGQVHTVCKPLFEYDELLGGEGFYRIHKAHLVNLRHIRKYVKGKGGHIVMSDGSLVSVAARKKDGFLSRLKKV